MTTEGFLSLAPAPHGNMDRLQYIAPLKANFDLDLDPDPGASRVRFLETETALTVGRCAECQSCGLTTWEMYLLVRRTAQSNQLKVGSRQIFSPEQVFLMFSIRLYL